VTKSEQTRPVYDEQYAKALVGDMMRYLKAEGDDTAVAAAEPLLKHKSDAKILMLLQVTRTIFQKSVALEKRVAALEVKPKSLDYSGTWQRAARYHRNEGTTHKSSIWVCVAETSRGNEPGTSPDWQLAEKDAR
jgi:hypothetical protein